MTNYTAPIADMRFVINELADLEAVRALPGLDEATPDLVDAILEEAGRFGAEVLAPLNRSGDEEGCTFENGVVRTPAGFSDAYARFVDGGWNGVPFDPEFGGQGLPWLVSTAVSEIWTAANLSFSLFPMLSQSAAEALVRFGSAEMKALYLPRIVSGEWNGTMNLTEPQAGSDLSRIRARAEPSGDHYRLSGQKIFVTNGEHDVAANIIHMVLARTPDAPDGIKGISLFMVPKLLLGDDGRPGPRNDLRCVSIEHKLGIRAAPTAVMSYGDDGGATAYLVGEENRGVEYMFTMMNTARLGVGLEGVGIAERAYQQARAYAHERVQGRDMGGGGGAAGEAVIARHPDVRRMLLFMKAGTEAARALVYFVAASLDMAQRHPDADARARHQALVALLTPVAKAWCTDTAIAVADTGVQVHGGMGYIEETGAAQHLRDARITAIYEGTNGIQALDLVGRKVGRDGGAVAATFIATVRALDGDLRAAGDDALTAIAGRLRDGADALAGATEWLVARYPENPRAVAAGAVHYTRLMGIVAGGWLMARAALAARRHIHGGDGDDGFARAKIVTARFFAEQFLVEAPALDEVFTHGWAAVEAAADDQL